MREIKFRAWDGKKMITDGDFWLSADGIAAQFGDDGNIYYTHYNLMQYTGLKDASGREIYEGDIVEEINPVNKFSHGKHEVYFTESGGYAPFEYNGGGECRDDWCEVIGNIYESPELLEGL